LRVQIEQREPEQAAKIGAKKKKKKQESSPLLFFGYGIVLKSSFEVAGSRSLWATDS